MQYRVVLQQYARQDLDEAFLKAAANAPETASRWIDRFYAALSALQLDPARHPLASENKRASVELRELLFGRKPNVFRVIFTIDEDTVRILRIRRAQRRPLPRKEIDESLRREL